MTKQNITFNLSGYVRMAEIATTAERKARIYVNKNGKTIKIKGKPAKKGILPLGESTIWDKVRSGDFPQPIRLSTRLTVWRIEDIEAWIKSKEFEV
ncbi:AlpA family phage regulatory protein [Acinetobacter baumannii]|uniref:helix-turn-helix transcriptional regulator n=1 Tax=Acinetobacter baumannii TaxID=470 RepID=UPI0032B4BF59